MKALKLAAGCVPAFEVLADDLLVEERGVASLACGRFSGRVGT